MVLELGKLQKYSCKFYDGKLVRQGNIHAENPNHFWNALFYAFKEYRNLPSLNEQIEYIQKRKTEMAKKMTKKEFIY